MNFRPEQWYVIRNGNRPNETLRVTSEDGDVGFGPFLTQGTEDWQIYRQKDRWFIRTVPNWEDS